MTNDKQESYQTAGWSRYLPRKVGIVEVVGEVKETRKVSGIFYLVVNTQYICLIYFIHRHLCGLDHHLMVTRDWGFFMENFFFHFFAFISKPHEAQTLEGINILVWTAVDCMVSILLLPTPHNHPPRMDRHTRRRPVKNQQVLVVVSCVAPKKSSGNGNGNNKKIGWSVV